MNNCHHFMELFFATAKLGVIFVPINFRLAAREVKTVLENCQPSMLFVGESVRQIIDGIEIDDVRRLAMVSIVDRQREPESFTDEAYEIWIGQI